MCFLLIILCATMGILIYAKYYNCDPLISKMVSKSDQVIKFKMFNQKESF